MRDSYVSFPFFLFLKKPPLIPIKSYPHSITFPCNSDCTTYTLTQRTAQIHLSPRKTPHILQQLQHHQYHQQRLINPPVKESTSLLKLFHSFETSNYPTFRSSGNPWPKDSMKTYSYSVVRRAFCPFCAIFRVEKLIVVVAMVYVTPVFHSRVTAWSFFGVCDLDGFDGVSCTDCGDVDYDTEV